MNKNKIRKQRIYILVFSIAWLIGMAFLYTILPDVIPIQFNFKGGVSNTAPKALYFVLVTLFYGGYLLYCWLRFKKTTIPNRQLITIYFLMGFSLLMLTLGIITT